MPEPTAPAGDGTQPASVPEKSEPVAPKTFTQEQLSGIIARELEPFKAIKANYEKLLSEQKEKELKETQDLEKLKAEIATLGGFKTEAESYKNFIGNLLTQKKALIPEDKHSLIPEGLSDINLLSYIEKNARMFYGTEPILQHPSGGKPPSSPPDPKRSEAEDHVRRSYPHLNPASEEFKKRVEFTLTKL